MAAPRGPGRRRGGTVRSRYQLAQRRRREIVDVPECRCDLLDLLGWHLVLLEKNAPFAYHLPDPRDALRRRLRGQGERLAAGKGVVEGCQPSLGSHTEVQAPLGRQAGSRHDIVERTEPPAGKARIPYEAVV